MNAALIQAARHPTVSIGRQRRSAPDEWVSIPELAAVTRILEAACIGFCSG
jgi:hypothetical protein